MQSGIMALYFVCKMVYQCVSLFFELFHKIASQALNKAKRESNAIFFLFVTIIWYVTVIVIYFRIYVYLIGK